MEHTANGTDRPMKIEQYHDKNFLSCPIKNGQPKSLKIHIAHARISQILINGRLKSHRVHLALATELIIWNVCVLQYTLTCNNS